MRAGTGRRSEPKFRCAPDGPFVSANAIHGLRCKWMTENNHDQVGILNASFTQNAPLMPHENA